MLARLSYKVICSSLVIFFLGATAMGGLNLFFHYTNRIEFCTACHSMNINFSEYKKTSHYQNKSGVRATCADCHVPREFLPMLYVKLIATRDVAHELAGTIDSREKFEARRWLLANRVWDRMRASDSRECRHCHRYEDMALTQQDKRAAAKHQRAASGEKTCIDCHAGIAHEEPLEPDEVND